jgi:hypothetical protein
MKELKSKVSDFHTRIEANERSVRDMKPTDDPEKNKRMQKKYLNGPCSKRNKLIATQDGKGVNPSST